MDRQVLEQVRGYPTQDGAGVQLCRVLGPQTAEVFDPILMLDSFDSTSLRTTRPASPCTHTMASRRLATCSKAAWSTGTVSVTRMRWGMGNYSG